MELGRRDWSLFGELNQKRLRPQVRPVPAGQFFERWPEVADRLQGHAAERRALAQVLCVGSA